MPEPTLSLCMVVQNDEATLARCLASVRPIVQEIVIVDMGSNDRTAEVAAKYSARVFAAPAGPDRSAARNLGLKKAKSNWILVLEPNEELAKSSQQAVRQNLLPWKINELLIYYLGRHLFIPAGEKPTAAGITTYAKPILIPHHPGFKYREALFEYLAFDGPEAQAQTMKASDLLVHHYMYGEDEQARRSEQTRSQLEDLLAELPDDVYLHYQYCRQLFQDKEYVTTVTEAYWVLAANMPVQQMKPIILSFASYFGAYAAFEIGRVETAVDLALTSIWFQYNLYGPWQVLVRAYLIVQNRLEWMSRVEAGLNLDAARRWLDDSASEPTRKTWGAFLFLGMLHLAKGDHKTAGRLLDQAAAMQPTFNAPFIARVENAVLGEQPQRALDAIEQQGGKFPHFQELIDALRKRLQAYLRLPKGVRIDRQAQQRPMIDLLKLMKEDWTS